MANSKESIRQLLTYRELVKQFKFRQVESLLETGQLSANTWLRFEGEDGDEEEATGLMVIARALPSAAEKRETQISLPAKVERRGSLTSSHSDSSGGSLGSTSSQGKVSKDRLRMASLFLSHGADINLRDAKGRTALMYAAINGLHELVYFFLNAGADFTMQETSGNNSLMFALPYPLVVKTFLDYMEETINHPDSSFWRQRTLEGKSIFDLAKESSLGNNPNGGPNKSLQLLAQFVTNYSHFTTYKAPPPLPEDTKSDISRHRKSRQGKSPIADRREPLNDGVWEDAFIDSQTMASDETEFILSQLDTSMKRSKSLREFWERETIDWFTSDHVSRIPSVIPPRSRGRSSARSILLAMDQTSFDSVAPEPSVKLPPIPSQMIHHEEWQERGHSLNRKNSIESTRTVNPIN